MQIIRIYLNCLIFVMLCMFYFFRTVSYDILFELLLLPIKYCHNISLNLTILNKKMCFPFCQGLFPITFINHHATTLTYSLIENFITYISQSLTIYCLQSCVSLSFRRHRLTYITSVRAYCSFNSVANVRLPKHT